MIKNQEDLVIPQIEFLRFLLDNSGRVIDNNFIYEIVEEFGKEVIVKPALAYIIER